MTDKRIKRRSFLKLTAATAVAPGMLASTISSVKAESEERDPAPREPK